MSSDSILFDITDGVAVLTFNRPAALNAMTNEMAVAFRACLDPLLSGETPARALVLTGAGRGFCAGADLVSSINPADFTATSDAGLVLENHYNGIIKIIRALPMPVIAAVNGPAAGVGMSLAMAADILVAARSASFLQAFVNIGLVPDGGSSWFLPRIIGRNRAARMMMLGEKISAEDAFDWGLVSKLVDDDKLMDESLAMARKLATGPTRAINLIRHLLDASEGHSLTEQLDLERQHQCTAGRYEDFREGVAAFLAKRKPDFSGK
ncbi:enoyl-CoA hydratase-related protein [Govanella unica]|uniref:Enoyl-CoA hydratase-related protein n=1 Tax=Govanella unica TaxID=2975056 RepID=A0A9X3Z6U6_9PROT|nr:enoyl-CoA hydratase-related protein [Govania unica]MDA5193560.1 enoyl-CoA hydratase-related protein [Govania unica]